MNSKEILQKVILEEFERELAEIPSNEELEKTLEVSQVFHRRIMYLIRGHQRRAWIQRLARNVAGFLLALIASVLILCAINEDVRAVCMRWIRTMMGESGMVQYQIPVSDSEKTGGTASATGFKLGYVPEGFVLDESVSGIVSNYGDLIYRKGDKRLCFRYIRGDTTLMRDIEHSKLSQIKLSDETSCDYYESRYEDRASSLVWRKDDYIFYLEAYGVEKEEMIQIADNIH